MLLYSCRVCGHRLFDENTSCVSCGSVLAYSRTERAIVPLRAGTYTDGEGRTWYPCAHRLLADCTWLADVEGALCSSCRLTRTRPADDDEVGVAALPAAEAAKRHLLRDLDALGLVVVGKDEDPEEGLAFDVLSSVAEDVVIGHQDGVITLDLAESDHAHRERVRVELGEPYRTMLGHLRHEVGHYAEWQLVRGDDAIERCRALFGDERADYQEAIERHYASGPPEDWADRYVSTYATMHPFEDFAETWAHLLHIRDSVESARASALLTPDALAGEAVPGPPTREVVVEVWGPLAQAMNQMSRSMGKQDLYPFVLAPQVLDKLDLVAALVRDAATTGPAARPAPGRVE